MKKTIDGHVYDTDTATFIGVTETPISIEELYRTRAGLYFLFILNAGSATPVFRPLDYRTAKNYARYRLDKDEYDREFGLNAATGPSSLNIILDPEYRRKLDIYARSNGMSVTDAVKNLIDQLPEGQWR